MSTTTPPFTAPVEPAADWRQALVFADADEAGILAALPGTLTEIAAAAGTDGHATRVVLDALEAFGIVSSGGNRYERGPAWPAPPEDAALHQAARFIRGTATHLPDRIRGEIAPPRGQRSPEDLDRWQAAMGARARKAAPGIVDAVLGRAPGARRVLDLGGGHGEYGLEFARRGLATVLQDRPAILDFPHRREAWAAGGVELFPGDFFETLPEGPFDVVFCAGVTHTFDGDHNRRLYQRVRSVLGPGGVFAIVTMLRGTPRARLFAIQMLVVGNRGDTHAEEEYRRWLDEAGFGLEVVHPDELGQAVLVARIP